MGRETMQKKEFTTSKQTLSFKNVAQVAQIGVWSAMIAAVGYLFTFIPNVEGITISTALAGATLGARSGAFIGGIGIGLYSVFNPWGPPGLILLIAQIIAVSGIGFFSGYINKWLPKHYIVRMILWSGLGLTFSLWYDVLTTLSMPILAETSQDAIIPLLIAQIPFTLVKSIVNVLLFAIVFEPLRIRLMKLSNTSLTMRQN